VEIINNIYETQVEIIPDVYEYKESKPIVSSESIKSSYPYFTLDENVDKDRNNNESEEEYRARVKQIAIKFKEIATKETDNYTVTLISHGVFLSSLISVLVNTDYLINSNSF
jgi:hypothetical protein